MNLTLRYVNIFFAFIEISFDFFFLLMWGITSIDFQLLN